MKDAGTVFMFFILQMDYAELFEQHNLYILMYSSRKQVQTHLWMLRQHLSQNRFYFMVKKNEMKIFSLSDILLVLHSKNLCGFATHFSLLSNMLIVVDEAGW